MWLKEGNNCCQYWIEDGHTAFWALDSLSVMGAKLQRKCGKTLNRDKSDGCRDVSSHAVTAPFDYCMPGPFSCYSNSNSQEPQVVVPIIQRSKLRVGTVFED